MSEIYEYEIKNGCFVVVDTKKKINTRTVLGNFTAKIVKKIKYVDVNGNAEIYYHIEGKTQQGEALKPIRVNADDYEKGKWFQKPWGGSAKLNKLGVPNKALEHLLCAISSLSDQMLFKTVYKQTGVVDDDPLSDPKFLFRNGAVTTEGIETTSYSKLPEQLNFFRLPKHINDEEKTKEAIKAVFNLLDFSENHYLGLVLCLAAIRATISMCLPIEQFIFLVSQRGTLKSSTAKIMEIIQSFFGVVNKQTPLLSWESSFKDLKIFAHTAKNCVLCVDDFFYPGISNRRHDFTVKAEQFLLAVTNGSPDTRATSHVDSEGRTRLNCLVVSTGEFPPRNLPESLHQHGIYVPFKVGDINSKALTRLQALAKDGTFVRANVAFIQYLLADFEKNSTLAEKWFEEARKPSKQNFQLNDRAACNMAELKVGWRFFRNFAMSLGVITKAEYKEYFELVTERLGSLMSEQKEIYLSNPGQLFIKGLRQALKEGKAHLIDSQTGLQPDKILPSKVGWDRNVQNGLWIGWRDAKKGEVFIRGNLDVEELINLLPEQDRHLYSKGATKFWKDLKAHGVLKCHEDDRNTTRKVFAEAETRNNYHLDMAILRTPKTKTIKHTQKPEKSKPVNKGKTNTAKKSIKGK